MGKIWQVALTFLTFAGLTMAMSTSNLSATHTKTSAYVVSAGGNAALHSVQVAIDLPCPRTPSKTPQIIPAESTFLAIDLPCPRTPSKTPQIAPAAKSALVAIDLPCPRLPEPSGKLS